MGQSGRRGDAGCRADDGRVWKGVPRGGARRGSARKPMPWPSLLRTQLSTMNSFSRPWRSPRPQTRLSHATSTTSRQAEADARHGGVALGEVVVYHRGIRGEGKHRYGGVTPRVKARLERVDAGHLDVLVELLPQRAVARHVRHHVGPLPLVRRDHPDLVRGHAAAQEGRHHLLHRRRLRAVEVARPARAQLLRAQLRSRNKVSVLISKVLLLPNHAGRSRTAPTTSITEEDGRDKGDGRALSAGAPASRT